MQITDRQMYTAHILVQFSTFARDVTVTYIPKISSKTSADCQSAAFYHDIKGNKIFVTYSNSIYYQMKSNYLHRNGSKLN